MKNLLFILIVVFFISCTNNPQSSGLQVDNLQELQKAIKKAKAGEEIIVANGVWKDVQIKFYGKHNQLDHCYVSGKSNDGETLRVFFTGNEHINSCRQIAHNYFGSRPRKGGPRAEAIRVGDSKTRVSPGCVNVSNNYFEACNGEIKGNVYSMPLALLNAPLNRCLQVSDVLPVSEIRSVSLYEVLLQIT